MNKRNLRYNEFGTVDCEIEHPEYGWIPFTVNPDDKLSPYSKIIHEEILAEKPEIAPYQPPASASREQREIDVRYERDRLLEQSDWSQLPDVPEKIKGPWKAYRQAMRDLPEQPGFPDNVEWPEPPTR